MLAHLAVIGATGAVGREFLTLIEERSLPVRRVSLFASPRSEGASLRVGDRTLRVEPLQADRLGDATLAVFCAGADISRRYAPIAAAAGCVVLDLSSAFRMNPDVPLIIPEINTPDLLRHNGLIANPNCTTIIMLAAVAPIHRRFPLKRIAVSTYQAVSGAGRAAIDELRRQVRAHLEGKTIQPAAFPHPIAFNLFAHDSPVDESGYNTEERKIIAETRKILHAPDLAITATCVRVPVIRAHSESVNLTFHEPAAPAHVRALLESAPGITVVDDRQKGRFPMPVEAAGRDDVLVGRIRADVSQPAGFGIELFVCGDQLRKGAALNALQIIETIASRERSQPRR